MPIVIYRPIVYSGFEWQTNSSTTVANIGYPANGTAAAAPYNRDTVAQEIARFTGWKTNYYRDTGEFSATFDQAACSPDLIKHGYIVLFDDSTAYRIEGINWKQTDNGYQCTITGRGVESFYDDCTSYHTIYGVQLPNASGGKATLETLKTLFAPGYNLYGIAQHQAGYYIGTAPTTAIEYTTAAITSGAGSSLISEPMSLGGLIRTLCNWFGVGYALPVKVNGLGNYAPQPVIFNYSPDNATTFYTDSRGVKGFEYDLDGRNAINSVLYLANTLYPFKTGRIDHDLGIATNGYSNYQTTATEKKRCTTALIRKQNANSFYELTNQGAMKVVDLGDVPDPNDDNAGYNDGSRANAAAWINQQMTADDTVPPTEAVTFSYDNTGQYKYGVDFGLGSWVTVIDEYLGLEVKQMLTQVKTNYSAGAAIGYDFTFGEQTITQADKLKSKFNALERQINPNRANV